MMSKRKTVKFNNANLYVGVYSAEDIPDKDYLSDIFLKMLMKKVKDNLREALNNYDEETVFVSKREYSGKNVIRDISLDKADDIVDKIRKILSLPQFYNAFLQEYINDDETMYQVVGNIVHMRNKTFLDYLIKSFSHIQNVNEGIDYTSVLLLKVFYPSMSFFCRDLNTSEFDVVKDIKKLLSFKFVDKDKFVFMFARHVRVAFGCTFGIGFTWKEGGNADYKTLHGRCYKVHTGSKGGKYIIVHGKKKYI